MTIATVPDFITSFYFVPIVEHWYLKPDAPKEVVEVFEYKSRRHVVTKLEKSS